MSASPRLYKRPQSVLIVVYTKSGQFLLLERTGVVFWQSVTGSLRWPDETPVEAAVREMAEETGITDTTNLRDWNKTFEFSILPEYRTRYAPGVETNIEHLFSLELPQPVDVAINTNEHSRYIWANGDEAREKVWSWSNREAIELVVAELGPDSGQC